MAGVPRWARIAALTIPFTVLPTCLWRIAAVAFLTEGNPSGDRLVPRMPYPERHHIRAGSPILFQW
ncbi:hypothetical protein [Thermomonospora umbrina]|uniref:hypothetical protein n=1 Tax=Thermomonospora umbrina TaxID=111806 RepID=UPI001476C309|nr:hypothetical protein [Thermomonospora umbrina]